MWLMWRLFFPLNLINFETNKGCTHGTRGGVWLRDSRKSNYNGRTREKDGLMRRRVMHWQEPPEGWWAEALAPHPGGPVLAWLGSPTP